MIARRRACAVGAHALVVTGSCTAFPDDVVVRVAVDGDVVVHGIRAYSAASHPSEDTGVEDAHEGLGGGWGTDTAFEELARGDAGVVELCVGVSSFDDGRAFKRDAGEETFGFGVGKDTGYAPETRCSSCFGIAAYGASGDGDIAAKGEGAFLGERPDGRRVIEDKDEVCQLEADLATKSTAACDNG